jgi:hypothetical protein
MYTILKTDQYKFAMAEAVFLMVEIKKDRFND